MKELAEYAYERDRSEFTLGDTLDIKTGLILISLTFLAIQSSELTSRLASISQTIIQIASIGSLAIGGIFAALELWPRDYEREAAPDKYIAWIDAVEAHRKANADAEPMSEDRLRNARLSAASERVAFNYSVNRKKSKLMFRAFYCALLAFAANLLTLVMRLS